MKKFSVLVAVILFAFQFSNAQTEKGTQTLGLNLGLNHSNDNNFNINPFNNTSSTFSSKTNIFTVGPNYSYFIADKLDIGASLSYNSTVTDQSGSGSINNPQTQASHNYGGSLYLRKYFLYKNKIGFRTGPYISYYKGDVKNTYTPSNAIYNYNSTTNNYNAGADLDLVYYPSKKFGMSATIVNFEYTNYKANNTTQGNENYDNLHFDFINNGLTLSVFYVFGGK